MQLDCWNIRGSGFHFGRHGLGQEQTMENMSSDSLFAALVARLARTKGADEVKRFCRFIEEKAPPPFVLSSTFPFAGVVRFFPVPMTARAGTAVDTAIKKLKRVKFVSEGVFRVLLTGKPLAQLYDETYTIQNGKLLTDAADFKRLPSALQSPSAHVWIVQQRPRVTLDRSNLTPNLFHMGQVHFTEGCGLWFGVRWMVTDAEIKQQFVALLQELAQTGFGAERTTGLGLAEVQSGGSLELPDANGFWVTLSRYLPRQDEMDLLRHKDSTYSIKSIGGWLDSPKDMGQRRRQVNMIEEGSVLVGRSSGDVPGKIVDVRPRYKTPEGQTTDPLGHAVYRSGLALAVGMQGGVI